VLLLFCSLSRVETTQAQPTDNHTVTVTVATITALQVSSGSVNLSITGAGVVAGQDLMTTVDESTNLVWGINSANRKITAQTGLVAQNFTVRVLAISPTQGSAASEVTLTTAAADFLLNVGRSSGSCGIRYTGLALASQGTGSDSHTITFTVTTQ
jgi:hypothetical protein